MTKVKYVYVCLMLLTILTVVIATTNGISAQRPTPGAVGLATWEYRIVTESSLTASAPEARANSYGEQGFELIKFETTRAEGFNGFVYHMVFRRPKH